MCAAAAVIAFIWGTHCLYEGKWLFAPVAMVAAAGNVYACVRLAAILFASPPMPNGVRLPTDVAHGLHRLIIGLARQFLLRPIDHVWITEDMNAAVLQRPRWGRLGPVETHLLIGLPMVHCVSSRQLTAVLAHEMSHLMLQRKGLGKYGALIRAWCLRVHDGLAEALPALCTFGDTVLRRFYHDMARLARIEEFEADALAAQLVGANLLGETLIELTLKERFLRKDYWPRVLAQSRSHPAPLIRPYRDMGLGMAVGFLRPGIHDAIIGETDAEHAACPLHPTLRERLRALRVFPCPATFERTSAAHQFLTPILPTLAWAFDRVWWEENRPDWRLNYRVARRERKTSRRS
jgi:Zn-dependent protease with chaperone function